MLLGYVFSGCLRNICVSKQQKHVEYWMFDGSGPGDLQTQIFASTYMIYMLGRAFAWQWRSEDLLHSLITRTHLTRCERNEQICMMSVWVKGKGAKTSWKHSSRDERNFFASNYVFFDGGFAGTSHAIINVRITEKKRGKKGGRRRPGESEKCDSRAAFLSSFTVH